MDPLLTTNCPSCSRQLKLPPESRGKNVRCPACQAIFKLEGEDRPAPPAGAITPRLPLEPSGPKIDRSADDRTRRRSQDEDDDDPPRRRQEDSRDAPRRRGSTRDEYDDDDWSRRRRSSYDDDYDDDDDYPEDRAYRRNRRRNARAVSMVGAAAIALIVLGFLEIMAALLLIGIGLVMPIRNPQDQGGKIVLLVAGLGLIFWATTLLIGAFMMKAMKSYAFALVASIMALVPVLLYCGIINIGFGIWAIVVLCDADVRRAFSRNER